MNIHIQNGRLIGPANKIDAQHDLYIVDGRSLAWAAPRRFSAERTIDASVLVIW